MSLDNNTYTNDSSILLIPQDLKGLKYSGYIILNVSNVYLFKYNLKFIQIQFF